MNSQAIASISVAVVDDDANIRTHLCQALVSDPGLTLVGQAGSVRDGLGLLEKRPKVLLVDIGLPDGSGLEVIRAAQAKCPDTEVAAITNFGDEGNVLGALQAGATGYLLKDGSVPTILRSIRELSAGGSPISPSIARHLLRYLRSAGKPADAGSRKRQTEVRDEAAAASLLTPRETTVLQQIAKGYSYDEISSTLGISVHTVTTHIKHIYRKLAVRSRGEAVFEAMQLGLIRLEAQQGG